VVAKRILIIDDDRELCEALMIFFKDEGHFAECTQDSVKGETLIRDGNYDIILLDYKMPLPGGIDILKNLKADNIRKRIFIISGRPSVEQALKEEDVSDMVSGIITKPFNLETLLEKINGA